MTPRPERAYLLGFVVVAGLSLAAGVAIGTLLQSSDAPNAEAANGRQGATAVVEEMVLERSVALRGEVVYSLVLRLEYPAVAPPGAGIVTRAPALDSLVQAGDVVFEVDGRPAIALAGSTTAYTDLVEEDSGSAVVALQEALAGLGYDLGDPASVFGVDTAMAVAMLYVERGYPPPLLRNPAVRQRQELDAALLELDGTDTGAVAQLAARYVVYGIRLPLVEYYYLPTLPLRVVGSSLEPGRPVTGGTVDLATSSLSVVFDRPGAVTEAPAVGMEVLVEDASSGRQATATVVEDLGGPRGTTDRYSAVLDGFPTELLGSAVTVRYTLVLTTQPVLVVPLGAVFMAPGGTPAVRVLDGDVHTVAVETGVAAQGFVEIVNSEPALAPGMLVILGDP